MKTSTWLPAASGPPITFGEAMAKARSLGAPNPRRQVGQAPGALPREWWRYENTVTATAASATAMAIARTRPLMDHIINLNDSQGERPHARRRHPEGHPSAHRGNRPDEVSAGRVRGRSPRPASLSRATFKEYPTRLREASARASDSDLGSGYPRASPLVNVHPSSRKRPAGKLVGKAFDLESLALPARVADGGPLVSHAREHVTRQLLLRATAGPIPNTRPVVCPVA